MSDETQADLRILMPVGATVRCPPPPLIALAATNGPWALPEHLREHLLEEDCAVCAQALTDVWTRHCPSRAVLGARAEFPAEGTFGYVLALHLDACDSEACAAAAAESLAPAADTVLARPEGLDESRWKALVDWLRGSRQGRAALLPDGYTWSYGAQMALQDAAPAAVRPRTFLDGNVMVEASDRDPERTSVWIAESAFALNSLRFVLQASDGQVLIDHVFANAGESPGEFPVTPALATAKGVAVFLWPVTSGA